MDKHIDIINFEIKREDLGKMISQLDQSLYNHRQWLYALVRILICKLPPDKHDLSEDAFKECRFGQWYYTEAFGTLKDHEGFKALGEEHRRMHLIATELLELMINGMEISPDKYDNFSNSVERLRLEIAALKQELEDLLYNRDFLTGLITRVNILPLLREYHEMSKRKVHSFCVVMADLDNFKSINDNYGHAAGDKVLCSVARFLLKNLRPYDKVFRYGGEEILFCLQDIELPQAFELIERLRKNLEEYKIDIGGEKTAQLTASFGIALLDPYAPIEASIENADKAMYFAKKAGRNRTSIWEESAVGKQ